MTTRLKKLTPNLMVEDVNRTIAFYKDILGFELLATQPESGQFDWAMMKRNDVEMMFQARASLTGELPLFEGKAIDGSLTFFVEVEDVKGLYTNLKDKVTIVQDMHATFYGAQEFAIQDCNGYILTFAEFSTEG
jgi:uncharacterized glyoxalase superfamily protein PhnB